MKNDSSILSVYWDWVGKYSGTEEKLYLGGYLVERYSGPSQNGNNLFGVRASQGTRGESWLDLRTESGLWFTGNLGRGERWSFHQHIENYCLRNEEEFRSNPHIEVKNEPKEASKLHKVITYLTKILT